MLGRMKRYSETERQEILERLEGSGLSRAAFCRREGLCYATVGQWVKRSRDAGLSTALTLVEVDRNDLDSNAGAEVTVELPGSILVRFGYGAGTDEIVRFCRGMSQC